jgi:hypothetical protein
MQMLPRFVARRHAAIQATRADALDA